MVNKHGFDRQQLQEILSQAKRLDSVLRLMDRQHRRLSRQPVLTVHGCATANSSSRLTTCKWRGLLESNMKMR